MQSKTKAIIAVLIVAVSFAAGRYTTPEKVKTETKIVEVEKKTKKVDTKEHKKTVIRWVTNPDGTKTKTEVITDDRDSNTSETDQIERDSSKTTEITRSSSKVTVSALVGMSISAPGVPIYGVSVTKPILGPITVGFFGLTNKTGGLSLGLTF